jgi:hypothetical protein
MARDENLLPIDALINEKIETFDSGEDKEHDHDLDRAIWELGDYENEEPLQDASEFKEEAPLEEELVEKEMIHTDGGRVYLKEPELVVDTELVKANIIQRMPLRIEIESDEYEIVCGTISMTGKQKLDAYCLKNDVTISDIWYENASIAPIMGKKWQGWHKIDGIMHEMALCIENVKSLNMRFYFNDEPLEDFASDLLNIRCEIIPKPRVRKGCIAVTAGMTKEVKCIFTADIADDFEPKKLTFFYKDFKALGIRKHLLSEVWYGKQAMEYSLQDYDRADFLDVIFLS